ncbi:hypothetical protein GCM10010344_24390 [Streptomyces bluensis]|nr:hypothetical protein GCM10010344_24390 [Streptomyces bluensis]
MEDDYDGEFPHDRRRGATTSLQPGETTGQRVRQVMRLRVSATSAKSGMWEAASAAASGE